MAYSSNSSNSSRDSCSLLKEFKNSDELDHFLIYDIYRSACYQTNQDIKSNFFLFDEQRRNRRLCPLIRGLQVSVYCIWHYARNQEEYSFFLIKFLQNSIKLMK